MRKKNRTKFNTKSSVLNENQTNKDIAILRGKFIETMNKLNLSYEEIDAITFSNSGYSERVAKKGSPQQVLNLLENLLTHGTQDIREVFKNYLNYLDVTVSSASNVIFPDKSASYLSTVLNPENSKTYSNEFVREKFIKFQSLVECGLIRVGEGKTPQEIAAKIKSGSHNIAIQGHENFKTVNEVVEEMDKKVENLKYKEVKMNLLIVTNLKTKKQEVIDVEDVNFKVVQDFINKLSKVIGINNDILITPYTK